MKRNLNLPLIPLAIAAVLAGVFGGYIQNDQTSLAPGSLLAETFGGSNAPLVTHSLIGFLVIVAFGMTLAARRVQLVPNQLVAAAMVAFLGLTTFSVAFSEFKVLSLSLLSEWLIYGVAFFAVVATAGRKQGPWVLLTAIGVGGVAVALQGIVEYGINRPTNPSWRIFAGWTNPNATAAVLLVGFFGILASATHPHRLIRLLSALGGGLILLATVLTGSKGTVSLALPVAILIYGLMTPLARRTWSVGKAAIGLVGFGVIGVCFLKNIPWVGALSALVVAAATMSADDPEKRRRPAVGQLLATFAIGAVLVTLIAVTSRPTPAGVATPVARLGQGNDTQDQSTTFRLNLWKSAGALIKERPVSGYGLGSYRYESARPGITTSTIFAHNSYLQMAAETGVPTLAVFGAMLGIWGFVTTQNRRALPPANATYLAATVSALAGLASHCLVDSDLSYFGLGLLFFMLLGLGLVVSGDSVAPELMPRGLRAGAILGLISLTGLMFAAAGLDMMKARVRYDQSMGDFATATQSSGALLSLAPFDGDALYLAGRGAPPDRQEEFLRRAADLLPTNRVLSALANVQMNEGKLASAESTLERALRIDPNNPSTLYRLARAQAEAGERTDAFETAKRLIAVEDTSYFKVRSLPDSVPTETYEVRIEILAPLATTEAERARLLTEAVRGMMRYVQRTVPIIVGNTPKEGPATPLPGYDDLPRALDKLRKASRAASDAAKFYRSAGDAAAASEMEAAVGVLDTAIPIGLGGTK